LQSVEIPKSWRDHATSWQLFRSAIAQPYFRTVQIPGEDLAASYSAARKATVSILSEVDTAPEFGTNVLRWLSGLSLAKMADLQCSESGEPCWMDYSIVCYMAGLDSALQTLDVASRQRLFRLAVWDADYFLSRSDTLVAGGPVGLMFALYQKPESFRGTLPPGVVLPSWLAGQPGSLGLPQGAGSQPAELRSAVAAAKGALGLTQRP
ncbi:MAG TPA: hypothetical protein VNT26_18675, partial [Candidatus Sulfotelmatobacter sp.]|nr:hypothetical protein [Candidatus Sulfotelmatobacter sp.]